jgi:predicted amidophosphoribosyltransferase
MCSSFWGKTDLFCLGCWQDLWSREQFRRGYFVNQDFPVAVLWSWGSSSRGIECLIRSQKHTGLEGVREAIFKRLLTYPLGPVPSTIVYVLPQNKRRDHASEAAQLLAKQLGARCLALRMAPRDKYKEKGRKERGQAQSILSSYKPLATERVWFYDDVITTGFTAKAVWEALGKPELFQVVALAHREISEIVRVD